MAVNLLIISSLTALFACNTPCAAVSCVVPVCPAGQVAKVPEGESCAVCVCEIERQTFSQCASDCPRSCDSPPGIVCGPTCRVGCKCPPNQVIDTVNKRCVPLEECPAESCLVKGQIRSQCGGCDNTCAQFISQDFAACAAVCRVGGCTCPPGQVIDTLSNECVTPDECPTSSSCPPTCSKEFCLANPRKPCSDPGPREIPGCRGRCQFSYCRACYVGDKTIFPPPGNCTPCNPSDYKSNTKCYREWARCTRRAHRRRFGKPDFTSDEEFRCYRPSCPFKG